MLESMPIDLWAGITDFVSMVQVTMGLQLGSNQQLPFLYPAMEMIQTIELKDRGMVEL